MAGRGAGSTERGRAERGPVGGSAGAVRERLRDEVGSDRFARYFGEGTTLAVDEGRVEVVVPTPFMADLITRRFGASLRRAAEAVGSEASPEVCVRVERVDRVGGAPAPAARPAQARREPARVPLRKPAFRHRLDGFIVGESNRLAHAAAVRIASGVDDAAFSPLFLHGVSGVGKTHLLQGIAGRYGEVHRGARVRYTTAEAFTNEYISAIRANATDRFRSAWRNVKLLCLDDVHFLRGKQSTQVELLHTLDAIGLRDARIVLASDEHPRRIGQLADQLVSRFMSGAVIRIDTPDEELARRLISELAAQRGLRLSEDAVAVLLQRSMKSAAPSVREIEGMLTQLEAVQNLAPDLCGVSSSWDGASVRRSLGLSESGASRRAGAAARRPIRLETIREEVCRALRVDGADLVGSGRHARVVLARGLIVHLARDLTALSFPEIARGLKRPNHSTVITAHKRILEQVGRGGTLTLGAELAGLTLADLIARLRGRVLEASGR